MNKKKYIHIQAENEYKNPSLDELESKMEELRDCNRQLREVNEAISHKLELVTQVSVGIYQNNTFPKVLSIVTNNSFIKR